MLTSPRRIALSLATILLAVGGVAVWRYAKTNAPLKARPVEARLCGFAYVPFSRNSRLNAAVLLAANRGPNDTMTAILGRNIRGATDRLRDATRVNPANAEAWSDLAAVLHAEAVEHDDPVQLAEALAANHRALREAPVLAEARFNEGLILASLGLTDAAIDAFTRYANLDRTSEWTVEARERVAHLRREKRMDTWKGDEVLLQRAALRGALAEAKKLVTANPLQARTSAETIYMHDWAVAYENHDAVRAEERLQLASTVGEALAEVHGDTFLRAVVLAVRRDRDDRHLHRLTHAYNTYYKARLLYRDRQSTRALPLFRAAAADFADVASPMSNVALYYVAQALYETAQSAEADALIVRLLRAVPADYLALRAQILWIQAANASSHGLLHQALAVQSDAMVIFEQLGETANFGAMATASAAELSILGRRAQAWRLRVKTFRQLSDSGDAIEMQRALEAAARTEVRTARWDVALPLLEQSLHAQLQQSPLLYASSLVWYVLAQETLGIPGDADQLQRALSAANAVKDPEARARALADVTFVRGVMESRRDANAAAALFDQYIDTSIAHDHRFFLPEAYVERARARRSVGNDGGAERDLRTALHILGDRTANVEQRSTYFRTAEVALDDLARLLVDRGDVDGAFAAIDDARAAPFVSTNRPAAPIAPGTTIVAYAALPERLLIFTRDAAMTRVTSVNVPLVTLNREAEMFADALARGGVYEGSRIGSWLVTPVRDAFAHASRIVIVPDRAIANVPFGALPAGDGRYLVEQAPITLVPAARLVSNDVPVRADSVVAIGDPAFNPRVFSLPRLPAAAAEAAMVAREYRGHAVVLTGDAATRENVVAAIGRAPIIHLATHAVVMLDEPLRSYLALAPSASSAGTFSLQDIERTSLQKTSVVVLDGCRTAFATHGAPVSSLALGFLAAGASNVVGSAWNISDSAATQALAVAFHRRLRAGSSPATALRDAQLSLIHSSDPEWRHPMAWSAFQLYAIRETER